MEARIRENVFKVRDQEEELAVLLPYDDLSAWGSLATKVVNRLASS